jgi:hypothetical protein
MTNKTGKKCCLFPALRLQANVGIAFSDMEVVFVAAEVLEKANYNSLHSAKFHVSCFGCGVARRAWDYYWTTRINLTVPDVCILNRQGCAVRRLSFPFLHKLYS